MGQRCPGSISDWTFYKKCEQGFLDGIQCLQFGILAYVRYRDDAIVVSTSLAGLLDFWEALTIKAKPDWTLELESHSRREAAMLDVWIFKHCVGNGRYVLRHRPYVKPTARHIPLDQRSWHPHTVHRSWPLAELQRHHRNSMMRKDFDQIKATFLHKLQTHFIEPQIIQKCVAWQPRFSVGIDSRVERVWLVLPYHPLIVQAIKSELRVFQAKWGPAFFASLGIEGRSWELGLSFSAAGPHLMHVLRRCSLD